MLAVQGSTRFGKRSAMSPTAMTMFERMAESSDFSSSVNNSDSCSRLYNE